MALPTPFRATTTHPTLRAPEHHVSTPKKDFDHLGALVEAGEDKSDFDAFCSAMRRIEEAVENDEQLAEDIALLLNRAHAHGALEARRAVAG